MSQSLSRRSFLKYAGSGAVSLAAALLTGVSGAALAPCYEANLLCWTARRQWSCWAMRLRRSWTARWSICRWRTSRRPLAVGASYLQSRGLDSRNALYSLGTGLTALCDGRQVRVGSFAAPLYGENAADASAFTLNLSAGRGAMLHCFCETPADWQALELIYQPDFAAGQTVHFVVRRDADEVHLGAVPATLAEVGSVVDL